MTAERVPSPNNFSDSSSSNENFLQQRSSPSRANEVVALPLRMTVTDYESATNEQSQFDAAPHSHDDGRVSDEDIADHTREASQSPPPYRPNRWKGSDDKWRRLTRPERKLIEQLDELENRDWSSGLYKAHLIKERRRRRLENDQELKTKNTQADWTAWPLYPEQVIQPDSRVEYKLRRRRGTSPSPQRPEREVENTAYIDLNGKQHNAAPDNISDIASDDESLSDPPSIADETEVVPSYKSHIYKAEPDPRPSALLEELIIAQMMKTGKEKFRERMLKPGFPSTADYTVSADDELMTMQLQPIARNILAQFDRLLAGMHQPARKRLRNRGRCRFRAGSESSNTNYSSARQSSARSSRKGSKAKGKAGQSTTGAHSATGDDDIDNDADAESGYEFRGRSRKRKGSTSTKRKGRDESMTASSFRELSSVSKSQARYRHPVISPSRKRMANRTWESVMLVSSIQNWPDEVLDRANQRLHAMFGRNAPLAPKRRDARVDHWDENLVCPVIECPRHMEPFPQQEDLNRHMQLIHHGKNVSEPINLSRSRSRSRSVARASQSAAEEKEDPRERKRFLKGERVKENLNCPVSGCRRHERPFSRLWNLKEHMKHQHGVVDFKPQPRKQSHGSRRKSATSQRLKPKSAEIITGDDDDDDDDDEEEEEEEEEAEEENEQEPQGKDEREKKERLPCPIKACRQHERGFSRKWNLKKHMKAMHPAWWAENGRKGRRSTVQ